MAYVSIPKDLGSVKSKVLFGLTLRQLVCFSSGAAAGVPLFFLLKTYISPGAAALVMITVMLPFFLLAMYEKNGLPLEKYAKAVISVIFLKEGKRPYRSRNRFDEYGTGNETEEDNTGDIQ